MPIIGSEALQKNYYRLTITMGGGLVDNVLVTSDGLYSVYYIQNGQYKNGSGRIPKVYIDYNVPQNSYILFDHSHDHSAQRERIYFYQVQFIKDITPNNAYRIAVEHGFVGTEEQWLASLRGADGKSAYEIAVECGYIGTKEQWLESLKGARGVDGKSAYEIAVAHGYVGTEEEWLRTLKGEDGEPGADGAPGKSAYEIAVEHGFIGTEDDWFAKNGDCVELKHQADRLEESMTWVHGVVPEN